MQLSENPNYAHIRQWLDLTYLSRRLLLESMTALESAYENPTAEMVDEAKLKLAELELVSAELREIITKRDN